jgi:hypothetical protein
MRNGVLLANGHPRDLDGEYLPRFVRSVLNKNPEEDF